METLPQIAIKHTLAMIDERQEEMLFKWYQEVTKKAKSNFPLEHLLNFFNGNAIKKSLLTSTSEQHLDRRSFISKKNTKNIPIFNFLIYPCQCMTSHKIYKMWLHQLSVKLMQQPQWDQYYKFITIDESLENRNFGIVTKIATNQEIPLHICICGESEWNPLKKKYQEYSATEIWIEKNLQNSIIWKNGAGYSMIARKFMAKKSTGFLVEKFQYTLCVLFVCMSRF